MFISFQNNTKTIYNIFIITIFIFLCIFLLFTQVNAETPYNSGYSHGCSDAGISDISKRYINQVGTGISNHTPEFMKGYDAGFLSCSNSTNTSDSNLTIVRFGVENHHPFVIVKGIAGGTKGDDSGDNEFGYVFYTDRGIYGAFNAFPNEPYSSSHITQKIVNGLTCLDTVHPAGHVVINGHKLTITGINIDRVSKALTELSFTDSEKGGGNCVDTIYSSKT